MPPSSSSNAFVLRGLPAAASSTRTVGAVRLAFVLGLLVVFSGCGDWPPEQPREVQEVAEAVYGSTRQAGGLGTLRVYVDRSLSMQPYLAADTSPYRQLLGTLDNLFGGDVQFLGFGFPSSQGAQVIEPVRSGQLLDAGTYGYVNNDYAALFAGLERGTATHLVISDGVQSEPTEGARSGGIVEAIDAWLKGGGVFTVMSYRTPYRGTYYHEVPRTGQVPYACDDRPVHVFGFFPSAEALARYAEIMDGERLTPAYQVSLGLLPTTVAPRAETLPAEGARRGQRVLRDLTSYFVPDVAPSVHAASVTASGALVPLPFNVTLPSDEAPWRGLSANERRAVLRELEPSLRGYRLNGWGRSDSSATTAVTPLDDAFYLQAPSVVYRPDTLAVVTVPVRAALEAGRAYVGLDLTLRLSPSGANRLIPADLSTREDAAPSACSQTLNLRRTLGAILREHYVVGRSLVLLKWTGAGQG